MANNVEPRRSRSTQLVVDAVHESMSSGICSISVTSQEILLGINPKYVGESIPIQQGALNLLVNEAYDQSLDIHPLEITDVLGVEHTIDIDDVIDATRIVANQLNNDITEAHGAAYEIYMVKPTDREMDTTRRGEPELEVYHEVSLFGSSAWEPENIESYKSVAVTYKESDNPLGAAYARMRGHAMDFRDMGPGDIIYDREFNIWSMVEPGGIDFTPIHVHQGSLAVYRSDAESSGLVDSITVEEFSRYEMVAGFSLGTCENCEAIKQEEGVDGPVLEAGDVVYNTLNREFKQFDGVNFRDVGVEHYVFAKPESEHYLDADKPLSM